MARNKVIEPFGSYPSQGLKKVIEKTGTQQLWQAGVVREAEIRVVFYETNSGVERIEPDGTVWKQKS